MATITGKVTKAEAFAGGVTYTVTNPDPPPGTEVKVIVPSPGAMDRSLWHAHAKDPRPDVEVDYDDQTPEPHTPTKVTTS